MLISHSKRFIFIHNYKVAGTSIKKALEPFNSKPLSIFGVEFPFRIPFLEKENSRRYPGHIQAKDLKKSLSPSIFNQYYKFGFVRNPWDWQVSLYSYMLKNKNHPEHSMVKKMKNFTEYIDWRVNDTLYLQKDFFYDENGECIVDFIGKYENLYNDFEQIKNKLNLDTSLPHLNKSRESESYLEYYDSRTLKLIETAFAEDISIFNYKKIEQSSTVI